MRFLSIEAIRSAVRRVFGSPDSAVDAVFRAEFPRLEKLDRVVERIVWPALMVGAVVVFTVAGLRGVW